MTETTPENPGEIQLGRVMVLEGHTSSIWSIAIKDNLIISGSSDEKIKIWDIYSGECIKTLEGHTDSVISVAIKDNLIISGSNDKTIRIHPITIFPNESDKFQRVINSYWLPEYLEQHLMDCFNSGKDLVG